MSEYPLNLFISYSEQKITKAQFINGLSNWQKSHGLNFDCKGVAVGKFVGITYRGKMAIIHNNLICFSYFSQNKKIVNAKAKSILEFRRKIDFLHCFNERRFKCN